MIYLDHAATAGRRPPEVIEAITRALQEASANPGRSGHRLSIAAARLAEDARWELAEFLGVAQPSCVCFTKNATEAINVVLHGVLREGDLVLAGPWEHNAVLRPLRELERRRGVRVEFLPPARSAGVHSEGIDLQTLERRVRTGEVRLVALSWASNVTGEVFPLGEAAEICRRAGVFLLADAAQAAGAVPIDLSATPVDALVVTGHKSLYGPPGTGALVLERPEEVPSLLQGGTGSRSEEEEQPEFPPDRFEAGTANVPGLAGLAAGIRHVRQRGVASVRRHHVRLAELLRSRLPEVVAGGRRLTICGPQDPGRSLAVVSFRVDGVPPDIIARELDRRDLFCRPGLHCSPRAHRTLGTFPEGTVRFSLAGWEPEDLVIEAVARLGEVLLAAGS